jgi:hypothetical protein
VLGFGPRSGAMKKQERNEEHTSARKLSVRFNYATDIE